MNLVKGALQDELDAFFKTLKNRDTEVRELSKAAFSKARKHLRHTAFIELNQNLLSQSYEASETKTWQGYRLLAVDGSTLRLPNKEQIATHFGRQQENNVPQARFSQLYDVLNTVTLDAQLSPLEAGERVLALKHLEHTQEKDLIIYDRGYPGFLMWSAHRHWACEFVMRMPHDFSNEVTHFINSDKMDSTVTIDPTRESIQACIDNHLSTAPIEVRLIKVLLDTGEIEILATSLLDASHIKTSVFKELYFFRWGVEEDYKVKKHKIEIENFSGLSVESIYQDVHAKVFTQNLVSLVSWIAEPEVNDTYQKRKHDYQINFSHAISKMKHTLVSLMTSTSDNCQKIVRSLVDIMVKTVEPIRKNRTYPRNKSRNKRVFHMNFKRTR